MRVGVQTKGLILVLIPVIFEFVFIVCLYVQLRDSERDYDHAENTNCIILDMMDYQTTVVQLLTELDKHQKDSTDFSKNFDQSMSHIQVLQQDMRRRIQGQEELKQLYEEIQESFQQISAETAKAKLVFASRDLGFVAKLHSVSEDFAKTTTKVLRQGKEIINAERHLRDASPKQLSSAQMRITHLIVSGISASIAISLGLAIFFSRNFVGRLKIIDLKAHRLASGLPLGPSQAPSDEIADLDRAIHKSQAMLAELRQRERAVVDNAQDVLCSLKRDLCINAAGASSLRAWGWSPQELQGLSVLDILDKPDRQLFARQVEDIAASQSQAEVDVECSVRSKDGELKSTLWTISWVNERDTFYCVVHDLSERRRVEAMKQRFVAIVGHDLKAPLSSVVATIALLAKGSQEQIPEAGLKVLARCEHNLDRLMDLIRDLLDLERLDSGKLLLNKGCVSVFDICTAARDAVEDFAMKNQIRVVLPRGDAVVSGDERRLTQVLINLLSNAIKFSPRSATVSMQIFPLKEMIEIRVSDEGSGIPAEQQQRIFERFHQTDLMPNADIKGTGLGLAIVKAIVQAHGGEVGVDSSPGAGSRFWIRLPEFVQTGIEG
jgi:PAS domain S-box-containing protein